MTEKEKILMLKLHAEGFKFTEKGLEEINALGAKSVKGCIAEGKVIK